VAGPLGSLALSRVKPHSSTAALRAVKWHQDLLRLGTVLPLFVVHDLGLVLCAGPDQLELQARCRLEQLGGAGGLTAELGHAYQQILAEARQSEAARRAAQLRMSDDLVAVVLARLLGEVARSLPTPPSYSAALPLDASLFDGLEGPRLVALYRSLDRRFESRALHVLVERALLVLTLVDALDLDTLRLFGMLGATATGALGQVELLASLEAPEANDVVNFSLEILPSVLETKTRPVAGRTAAFGYSGIARRGSVDSLVLTELAWDDLELSRRILDNEVLYYAREQSQEPEGRLHHLLIDASASMRGARATFARALALATGKKLVLEGEQVSFRFFDSRLYEPHGTRSGELPTAHLLSFKGERGRNPGRVFADLVTMLEVSRQREPKQAVVHVFTHAALYIPRQLVQRARALAPMAVIFMLPSGGKLALDYLDLLAAYWVVDHGALSGRTERADAARAILEEVGPQLANSARAPSPTTGLGEADQQTPP